jgi:uncharacterized protein (TIGR00251 family)
MPDVSGALSEDRLGTIIAIEVSAGSRGESFPAGYNEWRRTIGCRVSAPALEGKANKAVLTLMAKRLRLPVSMLSIQSGSTASQKRVLVAGIGKKDVLILLGRA